MAFSLRLNVYREASLVADVPLESANVRHRAMGGAMSAEFTLAKEYTDSMVAVRGDQVFLLAAGQIHFSGIAGPVGKTLRDGQQTIPATGWWTYLKTIYPLGADPTVDHENFGAGSDDHPTLPTAFDVAEYLVDTYVVPLGALTKPAVTFVEPAASTKLGINGFAVRQANNVADMLEILATMDDGWAGVTADGRVYYLNRANMIGESTRGTFSGSAQIDVERGEIDELGFTLLDAELVSEAYPETRVIVAGRDRSQFTRASRVYSLAGTDQPNRTHAIYAPSIIRGAGARRFARGRFARFGTTVEGRAVNISLNVATSAPVEPWRGRIIVRDNDGSSTILDQGVMGDVTIQYEGAITATVNIGELSTLDFGSRDPATDPYAPPFQRLDDPVVDIGDSGEIDFDDGFDGDGNDLHTNGAYVNQDDPGDGFYGTDLADPNNVPGGGSGSGSAGPSRLIYSPDPPLRTQALMISYAPNAGPLAEAEDVNLRWWKNAQSVDLGETAMVYNDSIARWEVTVTVPADAVQLNIQFNNDLADPLDIVDDNGGANWNLTTAAFLSNDADYALPLHGHQAGLPADGGDLFQNAAFPGTP